MNKDVEALNGACHCGTVRFHVRLSDGLHSARRCSCSFCRMRGAVAVSTSLAGREILAGADNLAEYRFNSGSAKHYFCRTCGIYTHHQRRSNPQQYGVNAACLEGLSPFDFEEIPVLDGVNHPKDSGQILLAGMLRFEAAPEGTVYQTF